MSDTKTDKPTDDTPPPTPEDTEGQVRDPEAVLAQNRKLEAEVKKLRADNQANTTELVRLREVEEATKSDRDKELDKIKREARKEVESEYARRLLAEQVKALAARKFNDPGDVVALINLDTLTDEASIEEALSALAESKPYLLTEGGKTVYVDGDQGQRGRSPNQHPPKSKDQWLLDISGRGGR